MFTLRIYIILYGIYYIDMYTYDSIYISWYTRIDINKKSDQMIIHGRKKFRPFLYVGHGNSLARCKSSYAPSWEEALVIGKGVVGDYKSERSH